jgi:hypothetical protein
MWHLKSSLDQNLIMVHFKANGNIKSHINFIRIKKEKKKWFLTLLPNEGFCLESTNCK